MHSSNPKVVRAEARRTRASRGAWSAYNARWGERPLPVLVLHPDSAFDCDVMVAYDTGKVAKWCIPDDIVIAQELPHTATGKPLKSRIRELFCAGGTPAGRSGDSGLLASSFVSRCRRPMCAPGIPSGALISIGKVTS